MTFEFDDNNKSELAQIKTKDLMRAFGIECLTINGGEKPNREFERELIHRWQDKKDQKALDMILEMHDRFIQKIAYGYAVRATNIDSEDFIQQARVGFLRSVNSYNLSQEDTALTTYARYGWMKFELSDLIKRNKTIHSRPYHISKAWQPIMREFKSLKDDFDRKTGGRPMLYKDKEEMGAALQESLGKKASKAFGETPLQVYDAALKIFTSYYGGYSSLDETMRIDCFDEPKINFLEGEVGPRPEALLQERDLSAFIENVLANDDFTERERTLLRKCVIGEDGKKVQINEMAKTLGITVPSVGQAIQVAELKLARIVRDELLAGNGYSIEQSVADIEIDQSQMRSRVIDKETGISSVDGAAVTSRTSLVKKGSACLAWVNARKRPLLVVDRSKSLLGAIIPNNVATKLKEQNPDTEIANATTKIFCSKPHTVQRLLDGDFIVNLRKHDDIIASYVSPDMAARVLDISKQKVGSSLKSIFEDAEIKRLADKESAISGHQVKPTISELLRNIF
jgi:RNA polymerase sigma factor (sigma-70 family)